MQVTDARLNSSSHIARPNIRGDDRGNEKHQQGFQIHECFQGMSRMDGSTTREGFEPNAQPHLHGRRAKNQVYNQHSIPAFPHQTALHIP